MALADASAYGALDDPERGTELLREHAVRLGPRYLVMLPLLAESAPGASTDSGDTTEHLQPAVQIDTRMRQLLSTGKRRTNEIKTAAPMLDAIDIAGLVITADALLTQRDLANYLVGREAHYHFTVKGNQPTLQDDIRLLFAQRGTPDCVEVSPPDHGRIETRRIWCSNQLNGYVDFPHVGQVFLIERDVIEKKSGKRSTEVAHGVTSCTPEQASPDTVLRHNRGHWTIENSCHYVLDQTWDEDHCRIRTGHGPENTSRLRRFAISVLNLHAKPGDSIASMTRKLASKTRLVFDYLLTTRNSTGHVAAA